MEVVLDRDQFAKSLGVLQGVVERKHTMPILANALLCGRDDGLEIVVTDLETCMRNVCGEVQTKEDGSLTANARKLYEVVKDLPSEEVHLRSMDNDWLEIRSGRAVFHIAGLPADDFPSIPSLEDVEWKTVPETILRRQLDLVEYAVSNDETRYQLNGVFLASRAENGDSLVQLVATDGHRLSLATVPSAELGGLELEKGVILPRKGVTELRKLLDEEGEVEIAVGKNHGCVRKGQRSILFQFVDGEFPDYQRVIPQDPMRKIEVGREELLRALQRVSLISADRSRGVKIEATSGELKVSSNHPDLGEAQETVAVEYDEEDVSIGFNANYLVDILRVLSTDIIELEVRDGLSQGVIREKGNEHFLAIVMPMRI